MRTRLNKNLLISTIFAVLNLILIVYLAKTNNIKFESCDDQYYYLIYAGVYGEYSPYVFFQNILFGKIMCFLYEFIPICNWYVITFLFLAFLSYTSLSYIFIKKQGTIKGFIFSLILLLTTYEHIYTNLNFTQLTAWFTLTGILLIVQWIYDSNDDNHPQSYLIIPGCILLCLGSLLRFNSFLFILPFTICLLDYKYIFKLITLKQKPKINKKGLIVLFIMGAFILISHYYNQYYYDCSTEWQYIHDINHQRATFWDRNAISYSEKKEIITSIGFSENDYNMLDNYCISDEKVFSRDFWNELSKHYRDNKLSKQHIKDTLYDFYHTNIDENHKYVILIIVVSLFATLSGSFNTSLALVLCMLEAMWLIYSGRYPERAYVIPFYSLLIISLYNWKKKGTTKSISINFFVTVSIFIYLIATSNITNITSIPSSRDSFLFDLAKENRDKVLVVGSFPVYEYSILQCPDFGSMSNIVTRVDYIAQYPQNKKVLQNMNMSENLYEAIAQSDNILFVGNQYLDETIIFINEHYDSNVIYYQYNDYCYGFYK